MHHRISGSTLMIASRRLAMAGATVVALGSFSPIINLEASSSQTEDRLPIYDPPSDGKEILVIREKGQLEQHIRSGRQFVQQNYGQAESKVQSLVEKWLGVEKDVERTVKSIIQDEPLLPGAIYVGISGLAGTILVRHRGILLRFTTPLLLSLTSAYYFLPKTTVNTVSYLEARFPSLQRANDQILNQVQEASKQINSLFDSAKESMTSTVNDGRKLVQEQTGLKLGDTDTGSERK